MPQSIRAAQDIWENLRSKRGPELLKALADELAALYQLCADLEAALQSRTASHASMHLLQLDEPPSLPAALPTRVDLYASQLFEPQDGFYNLEYTADGVPFRWTGPQRYFSFAVNLDRSTALVAELELVSMIDEKRQRDMTLLVDGASLPFRVTKADAGYIGHAIVPIAPPQDTTTLTFVVPSTSQPGPADRRELGVAFSKLKIRPAGAESAAAERLADETDRRFEKIPPEAAAPAKRGSPRGVRRRPKVRASA